MTTMTSRRLLPMLMAPALLLVAGCINTFRTGPVPGTDANQEIRLAVTETVTLDEDNFAITFARVLDDSRCPSGTQCVSAGNAEVGLILQERGEATRMVRLNTTTGKRAERHEGYRVEVLGLEPLPTPAVPEPTNYVVRLKVTRG